MKVKNYNQGNYLSAFDCIIYGHIEMTQKEWKEACTYLMRATKDPFYKRMLKEDILKEDRNLVAYTKDGKNWRNVRVTATQLLFKKYNLPRYKQKNYAIKIINK